MSTTEEDATGDDRSKCSRVVYKDVIDIVMLIVVVWHCRANPVFGGLHSAGASGDTLSTRDCMVSGCWGPREDGDTRSEAAVVEHTFRLEASPMQVCCPGLVEIAGPVGCNRFSRNRPWDRANRQRRLDTLRGK